MTDEEFDETYNEAAFVLETVSEDGTFIEICSEGSKRSLTRANAQEYIDLYLKAYTRLDEL